MKLLPHVATDHTQKIVPNVVARHQFRNTIRDNGIFPITKYISRLVQAASVCPSQDLFSLSDLFNVIFFIVVICGTICKIMWNFNNLSNINNLFSSFLPSFLPTYLPTYLQMTFSTIQTLNRPVLQFLRCLNLSLKILIISLQTGTAHFSPQCNQTLQHTSNSTSQFM